MFYPAGQSLRGVFYPAGQSLWGAFYLAGQALRGAFYLAGQSLGGAFHPAGQSLRLTSPIMIYKLVICIVSINHSTTVQKFKLVFLTGYRLN